VTDGNNKMELGETHSLHSSKTSTTAYQSIQCNIPEDLNLQHYRKKLRSHTALSIPH